MKLKQRSNVRIKTILAPFSETQKIMTQFLLKKQKLLFLKENSKFNRVSLKKNTVTFSIDTMNFQDSLLNSRINSSSKIKALMRDLLH